MSRFLSLVSLALLYPPLAFADGSFNILIDESSIPPTASGVAAADDGDPENGQLLFLGVGGTGDPPLTLSAYRIREALHTTMWELQDTDGDTLANGDEAFQFQTSPYSVNSNAAEEIENGWTPLNDPQEPVAGRDGPASPTFFDVRLTVPYAPYEGIMVDGGVWPDGQSSDPAFGPGNITINGLLDLTSGDPSHRADRNLTFNAHGALYAVSGIDYHATDSAQPSGGALNLFAHGGNVLVDDIKTKTTPVDCTGGSVHINSFGGTVETRAIATGQGPGQSGNITVAADNGVLIGSLLFAQSSDGLGGDVTVTARNGDVVFPEIPPLIARAPLISTAGGAARVEAFNGNIQFLYDSTSDTNGGSFVAEASGDVTGVQVSTLGGDFMAVSDRGLVQVRSMMGASTGGDAIIAGRHVEIDGPVNAGGTIAIGPSRRYYDGDPETLNRHASMRIGGTEELSVIPRSAEETALDPTGQPWPCVTLRDAELSLVNSGGWANVLRLGPESYNGGIIEIVSNTVWDRAPVISISGFLKLGPGVVVPPTTKLLSSGRFSSLTKASAPLTVGGDSTLAPGNSPGMALFGSDLTFSATSELEVEIAGPTPGTEHDQVEVDGDLDLDGTLRLRLLDGFVPTVGQSFTIATYGGNCSGNFAAVEAGALSVSVNYGTGSNDAVTVTVNSIAANNAPSFTGITSDSVPEDAAPGDPVGTLSATDPDGHDSFFWWELVSVDGDPNSNVFTIVGDELVVAERLNSEIAASYEVTARVYDAYGAYDEITGPIDVTPVVGYDYDGDRLGREDEQALGTSDLDRDSDDDLLDDRWERDSGTNPLADDALATNVFTRLPNLVGYALGYDGLDADRSGLGLLPALDGSNLTLSFGRRRGLQGLDLILESSPTPSGPWSEELRWNEASGWSAAVDAVDETALRERVTTTLPVSGAADFQRIRVEATAP